MLIKVVFGIDPAEIGTYSVEDCLRQTRAALFSHLCLAPQFFSHVWQRAHGSGGIGGGGIGWEGVKHGGVLLIGGRRGGSQ